MVMLTQTIALGMVTAAKTAREAETASLSKPKPHILERCNLQSTLLLALIAHEGDAAQSEQEQVL